MKKFVVMAPACVCLLCFSCAAWTGPLLRCPESIEVGEEGELVATQVDASIHWRIQEPNIAGAFFVAEEGVTIYPDTEATLADSNVLGDPGSATGTAIITIRASKAGLIQIVAQEINKGPGIGLPRPRGSAECIIEVHAAAE